VSLPFIRFKRASGLEPREWARTIAARMGHVTPKMTERYFDPLADNGAGTDAVASLLGVEDGAAESPADRIPAESNGRLTLNDDNPFRLSTKMLAALTEQYLNIAIGKILDASEAAVRMMLKRAGESGVLVPRRLAGGHHQGRTQGGTGSEGHGEWHGDCRLSQSPTR